MTWKVSNLRTLYATVLVGGAVALPSMFYALGFQTVGGALLLSSVLVIAVSFVKSSALATLWLTGQRRETIANATRYELTKSMVAAALAVDALAEGIGAMNRYGVYDVFSMTSVFTVAGLLVIAAGLFLTRWFAGYLHMSQ